MILAFVGGFAIACGLIWFFWWLLFAPIEPLGTEHKPFYGDSL